VDELVRGPRFADHWASIWEGVLLGPGDGKDKFVDRAAFHDWVRRAIQSNVPYDRFVRELVTATGRNTGGGQGANGAVNWLLRFREAPEDLAGTTSRAFLGVQIQCAECHDHKTEAWKQADFRRFTACFLRTRAEPVGPKEDTPREVEVSDVDHPAYMSLGKKRVLATPYARARPGAIDGTDLARDDAPREALARWITSPQNPWFSRAFVNRVAARLFGRGFVEPVDDVRPSNPGVLPDVLARIADDFAAGGYDVRRLVTLLADTEVYGLAAAPAEKGDGRLFSRFPLKPLGPDELLDAIVAAAGLEPVLARAGGDGVEALREDLRRQVTYVFDVDEPPEPGAYAATVAQALYAMNGRLVNGAASAVPGGALERVLDDAPSIDAAVEALYLRALSRRPSREERVFWRRFVRARRDVAKDAGSVAPAVPPGPKAGNGAKAAAVAERKLVRLERLAPRRPTARQQAFEDLFWSLLASSEFAFNH
ncbi:MAG TPA: DUF1553 domain-containing protein, partial [Minicystis sp.]|nr:DUF1553 domain-containing protein [Minicystis sp.]